MTIGIESCSDERGDERNEERSDRVAGNVLHGGCLCEAIRYSAQAPPLDVGYCHCRSCQRVSGAPVLVWVTVPVASFRYEGRSPAIYPSSAHGQREFCPQCGSQLAFREGPQAASLDLNVGGLDDPGAVAPDRHIWTANRIAWFDTADPLPRHEDGGPEPAHSSAAARSETN
jgi:hypothetical protein